MRRTLLAFVATLTAAAIFGIGYIQVSGDWSAAEAQETMEQCMTKPVKARIDCVNATIDAASADLSFNEVNTVLLDAVLNTGVDGLEICHLVSERIGVLKADREGLASLNSLFYGCLGGPMHGVFYRIGEIAGAEAIVEVGRGLCEQYAAEMPWIALWDCRHGIGHAIAVDHSYSFTEQLELCESVYTVRLDIFDCATGVFGGMIDDLYHDKNVDELDSVDNLPSWCRSLADPYDDVCLQRVGVIARGLGYKPESIPSICEGDDSDCAYGVGYYVGQFNDKATASDRASKCLTYPEGDVRRFSCFAGVMRAITPDYWLSKQDPGVCALARDAMGYCLAEQERMRAREANIDQLAGREPYIDANHDLGGWPGPNLPAPARRSAS